MSGHPPVARNRVAKAYGDDLLHYATRVGEDATDLVSLMMLAALPGPDAAVAASALDQHRHRYDTNDDTSFWDDAWTEAEMLYGLNTVDAAVIDLPAPYERTVADVSGRVLTRTWGVRLTSDPLTVWRSLRGPIGAKLLSTPYPRYILATHLGVVLGWWRTTGPDTWVTSTTGDLWLTRAHHLDVTSDRSAAIAMGRASDDAAPASVTAQEHAMVTAFPRGSVFRLPVGTQRGVYRLGIEARKQRDRRRRRDTA